MNYATDFKSIREQVSPEEWQARLDLAACYRLVDAYGMTDLIYNHITARIPGSNDHLLINLYGMLYKEITASSLAKIDVEGEIIWKPDTDYGINKSGYVIHGAIHEARPDVACVLHTHTRAGIAVSAMKCGLLPLAGRRHGRAHRARHARRKRARAYRASLSARHAPSLRRAGMAGDAAPARRGRPSFGLCAVLALRSALAIQLIIVAAIIVLFGSVPASAGSPGRYDEYQLGVYLPYLNAPGADEDITALPRLRLSFGGRSYGAVMDTGSTGVVVSADKIPNIDGLESLGAGELTYSSSGRIMIGR